MRGEVESRGQERSPSQEHAPSPERARPRIGRFSVRTHIDDRQRTLAMTGELDLASALKLERTVDAALAAGASRVILDMRRLEFIDASGLHSIVQASDACREAGCEFMLVPGPHHVQRVFELTGMLKALKFSRAAEAETL